MSEKLSALVITLNEEENIREYLENMSFADEIIVVDSGSTDKTLDIVREFPDVKLIHHDFVNFSSQKNFAINQANYDWVIFFDADERMDDALKEEIRQIINDPKAKDAYLMYRRFYFMGKHIKHSGWRNDRAVRLFRKDKCKYGSQKYVHETIECNGEVERAKNKLDHYSYRSFEEYNRKLDLYSKLKAQELYEKKVYPNPFHFIVKPSFRFLHHFVFGLGFLDGKEGYIISRVYAYYVFKRYVFLWRLWKNGR